MCAGIAVSWRELPEALVERYELHDRVVVRTRGADRKIRFLFRDPRPVLPVWYGSELDIYLGGKRAGARSRLPRTGWCKRERLEAGL